MENYHIRTTPHFFNKLPEGQKVMVLLIGFSIAQKPNQVNPEMEEWNRQKCESYMYYIYIHTYIHTVIHPDPDPTIWIYMVLTFKICVWPQSGMFSGLMILFSWLRTQGSRLGRNEIPPIWVPKMKGSSAKPACVKVVFQYQGDGIVPMKKLLQLILTIMNKPIVLENIQGNFQIPNVWFSDINPSRNQPTTCPPSWHERNAQPIWSRP